MDAISYTAFRNNLRSCIDEVVADSTPLIVTSRQEGSNVVVLSQRDYDNLMENFAVASDAELMDKLRKSAHQFAAGDVVVHELVNPDA